MNPAFTDQLHKLVLHWTDQGIRLNSGIPDIVINKLESDLDISLNDEFKAYLKSINGFLNRGDLDNDLFSFWSDTRIIEENMNCRNSKDLICFADHSVNLCVFGFNREHGKIYIFFQKTNDKILIANSLSEFIDLYLKDAYLLLR